MSRQLNYPSSHHQNGQSCRSRCLWWYRPGKLRLRSVTTGTTQYWTASELAIVPPLQDLTSHRRSCIVRCSQYPRCRSRSVTHLLRRCTSLTSSRPMSASNKPLSQTIGGYVAAPGDFKGEKPETEEAKKAALSGADIVIIPAGVPSTSTSITLASLRLTLVFKENLA